MKPKDLRDEFALSVLPEVTKVANEFQNDGHGFKKNGTFCSYEEWVAGVTYTIANAMMAEREKTNATD